MAAEAMDLRPGGETVTTCLVAGGRQALTRDENVAVDHRIPATVSRIRLGELPRVLERDEAASTVVAGLDVTDRTAGEYDLVAFDSPHRLS